MEATEESLLTQRQKATQRGESNARLLIAGSCLLAVGAVLMARFAIQQDFTRTRVAEAAVRERMAEIIELAAIVEERTVPKVELAFQVEEKSKRADELAVINTELTRSKDALERSNVELDNSPISPRTTCKLRCGTSAASCNSLRKICQQAGCEGRPVDLPDRPIQRPDAYSDSGRADLFARGFPCATVRVGFL
jgi:hypothetical protein